MLCSWRPGGLARGRGSVEHPAVREPLIPIPFGRSRWVRIPSLAYALLEILDALGLERVVLVGNSMGGPVCLEVAHSAPERVAGIVLASPAGGMHNQPLARALVQLTRDALRENPLMARVVLPDYVRFGPLNALQLFGELMRFPSLERILRTPVPTLAVIGTRDPLMPPPWRVQEVGRLAPAAPDHRGHRGRSARHELQPST